jgi:hypothetical protein
MHSTRTFIGGFVPALLAALVIGLTTAPATAAPPDNPKELFPGAKLMHKFPKEVYRAPIFVTTDKGTRLEIWFDAFDPEPPPKPGVIPEIAGKLPDPRIEMLIWDPIASKELHKFSYPKDPIAYPRVSDRLQRDGGMAISPDDKRLASQTITYTPRRGSPYGDFTTRVKLIDFENRKVQGSAEYKDEKSSATPVSLLFAPDGALVTLRGSDCTIQEHGKDKPRTSFELTRAAKGQWSAIHDVVVSADGSQLAVAADGTIIVYGIAKGKKLFEAARAAPEPKKGGDQWTVDVALAYAPSASDPKLLAVESVVGSNGAKKDFAVARLFDLKDMKETGKCTVAEQEYPLTASAYFTAKGEPRILYDGKVLDGATGKELHKFDPGAGSFVSRDGKALVRMTKKKKENKTMTVEVWSLDNEK